MGPTAPTSTCGTNSRSGAPWSRRSRGRERVKELHGTTAGSDTARTFMGRAVARVEDNTLLRGAGRFIDDIVLPGLLHACFVRSPVAHARLTNIDAEKARA